MLRTGARPSASTRRNSCSVVPCVSLSSDHLARWLNALRDLFKQWRQAFRLRYAKQRNDYKRRVRAVELGISRQCIAQRFCDEIGLVHLLLISRRLTAFALIPR